MHLAAREEEEVAAHGGEEEQREADESEDGDPTLAALDTLGGDARGHDVLCGAKGGARERRVARAGDLKRVRG